jgi:hypothetical protein
MRRLVSSCPLVRVQLRVGEARVVVDDGVQELVADTHALLGPGAITNAGDRTPGTAEAGEALPVDVQEVAEAGTLAASRCLARQTRKPREPRSAQSAPDGRVRVAGLASDEARAPARAAPGRTDPELLGRRQHARRAERPRGAIVQTAELVALRLSRLQNRQQTRVRDGYAGAAL